MLDESVYINIIIIKIIFFHIKKNFSQGFGCRILINILGLYTNKCSSFKNRKTVTADYSEKRVFLAGKEL